MIDLTVGEGGHAEAFLLRYPDLALIGVDADSSILEVARQRLAVFASRARLVNAWFGAFLSEYVGSGPISSSWTLASRGSTTRRAAAGFSFDRDEALDMRLSEDLPTTAADIVNTLEQAELADILFRFGEESFARAIAARIVRRARKGAHHQRDPRLAAVVAAAVPAQYRHSGSTRQRARSRPCGSP